MSAPDFAGVLAAHRIVSPAGESSDFYACLCHRWSHRGHDEAGAAHRAHVAAALDAEVVTWLGSEVLRADLLARVNAEDDAQFASGAHHGLGAHDATDFVLAAVAAQVAPPQVPSEEL